ncbi:hypothetical protein SAMN05216347_1127 [Streptococcus equinus]|uniref:Tetratricopeptide repeat protein n=2 Tax=Streptococcus equinus TaxID=1335 RepID=A0A1H0RBS6_STREI|nr:hypothetical protein [Streptococcus equinus]SDP26891.1 hypothetical protein SAMN05216347_1127 [Streptococcus equinus]
MKDKYVQKLSKKSGKEIVVGIKKMQYFLFALLIILALVGIYWYSITLNSDNKNFTNIIFIFMIMIAFLIFAFFLCFSRILSSIIDFVFYEQIDFEKYLEILDILYKIEKNKKIKKEYFQINRFGMGQVEYFSGNFEKSLHILERIDLSKVTLRHRDFYQNSILYFKCLNYIMLKDVKKVEEMHQSFRTNSRENSVQNILEIIKGNVSDYVFESEPRTKLVKIGRCYYQALNYLNANDKSSAKENFQKIANENPELFYVREAKKYLEELDNK